MKTFFTITAGRTGTAWLRSFLSLNFNIEAIHEPLGIDDFGTQMPDIKTMRNFNNFGKILTITKKFDNKAKVMFAKKSMLSL